jgi:hypothetical protein
LNIAEGADVRIAFKNPLDVQQTAEGMNQVGEEQGYLYLEGGLSQDADEWWTDH